MHHWERKLLCYLLHCAAKAFINFLAQNLLCIAIMSLVQLSKAHTRSLEQKNRLSSYQLESYWMRRKFQVKAAQRRQQHILITVGLLAFDLFQKNDDSFLAVLERHVWLKSRKVKRKQLRLKARFKYTQPRTIPVILNINHSMSISQQKTIQPLIELRVDNVVISFVEHNPFN